MSTYKFYQDDGVAHRHQASTGIVQSDASIVPYELVSLVLRHEAGEALPSASRVFSGTELETVYEELDDPEKLLASYWRFHIENGFTGSPISYITRYRLNMGITTPFVDADGNTWGNPLPRLRDYPPRTSTNSFFVPGTILQEVYNSDYQDDQGIHLEFNTTAGRDYMVRLQLSDFWQFNPGDRIFDIYVDDMVTPAIADLDLIDLVGRRVAYAPEINVTASTNRMRVELRPNVDEVILQGIEVFEIE